MNSPAAAAASKAFHASLRTPLRSRFLSSPSRRLSSTVTDGLKNSGKASHPRLLSVQAGRRFSTAPSESGIDSIRQFSSTPDQKAKNRIYTPVRRPDEFLSYLHASTSFRIPLVTLWTASYSPACKTVGPLVHSLVNHGVGETSSNSVNYCEVEFDSPDIAESDLGLRYMITSLPTLVTFDRGEIITETKITDVDKLKDEEYLIKWLENEAKRKGQGTGPAGGLFGGLFSWPKQ